MLQLHELILAVLVVLLGSWIAGYDPYLALLAIILAYFFI